MSIFPVFHPGLILPGIGVPIKQSFFLLQTTVPDRFISQHKLGLFLFGDDLYLFTDPNRCSCIYSVLVMHRRTDLWGPDGIVTISFENMIGSRFTLLSALVFDPDRFLDERLHKYLTPNPFIFCPFNAGPRICLGQQVC